MSCPQWEERLNDFVDGSLATSETLAVEEHLLSCDGCRAQAESLRTVLRTAAALPRWIEPERNLWPAIAQGLHRPRLRRVWPGAAAAALILAATAVTSTFWRTTSTPAMPDPVVDASYLDGSAELKEAEQEFRNATVKLMAALERRKADLPPRTIAEIEENLRVLNKAIAETGAAVARDPENRQLGRLLTNIYSTRLQVLSNAVRGHGAV